MDVWQKFKLRPAIDNLYAVLPGEIDCRRQPGKVCADNDDARGWFSFFGLRLSLAGRHGINKRSVAAP